ncbi:hypothetical protein ACOMHN_002413 [Nucella lapillus]
MQRRRQVNGANKPIEAEKHVHFIAASATPGAVMTETIDQAAAEDEELETVRQCIETGHWQNWDKLYAAVRDRNAKRKGLFKLEVRDRNAKPKGLFKLEVRDRNAKPKGLFKLEVRDRNAKPKGLFKLEVRDRNAKPKGLFKLEGLFKLHADQLDIPFLPKPFQVVEKSSSNVVVEAADGASYCRNSSHVKRAPDGAVSEGNSFSSPRGNSISSPRGNSISSPRGNSISSSRGNSFSSPRGNSIFSPRGNYNSNSEDQATQSKDDAEKM